MTSDAQGPGLRLLRAGFDDQAELRRAPGSARAEEQPLVSDGVRNVQIGRRQDARPCDAVHMGPPTMGDVDAVSGPESFEVVERPRVRRSMSRDGDRVSVTRAPGDRPPRRATVEVGCREDSNLQVEPRDPERRGLGTFRRDGWADRSPDPRLRRLADDDTSGSYAPVDVLGASGVNEEARPRAHEERRCECEGGSSHQRVTGAC